MRGRKLSSDELDLWKTVAKTVTRTAPIVAPSEPQEVTKPRSKSSSKQPLAPFEMSSQAKIKDNLVPTLSDRLRSAPVDMDKKVFSRMRKGKLRPEGKIDLHGMTVERAHSKLTQFVLSSHRQGKRLLLVITGKGKNRDEGGPIPVRYGVLRHQVPEWLRLPPLSNAVLQIVEAHQSHGGSGAFYVYLRRAR
jgi:DNA-nicking Smr family endonuclease